VPEDGREPVSEACCSKKAKTMDEAQKQTIDTLKQLKTLKKQSAKMAGTNRLRTGYFSFQTKDPSRGERGLNARLTTAYTDTHTHVSHTSTDVSGIACSNLL
jgi:putative SOS response-associated peptidase YedK